MAGRSSFDGARLLAILVWMILFAMYSAYSETRTDILPDVMVRDRPWADVPKEVLGTWFETLTRDEPYPESSETSCCKLADAYEANVFDIGYTNGVPYYIAVITDGREWCFRKQYSDDEGRHTDTHHCRKEIPTGTKFAIPEGAHVLHAKNPSGHGVIFISQNDLKTVYCWVSPAGM